jgi:aminoglycoside phosphotransferase (APT) family kinase protein
LSNDQPSLNGPDAFSAERWERAHAALVAALGPAPIGVVRPVAGGASGASPFRVEVGGRWYLVRVEGVASPLRNPHQYVSMRMAAEAGIAPRVHWVDEVARVAVTDFIDQRPLASYPGGQLALVQAIALLLRRLQATPVFPHFVAYNDIVARLFAHVRRTGLFAAGVLDPHAEQLERISKAYAIGLGAVVSSHNDPIPSNILFDGERLWLIDWESAYCNDPLVDVAIVLDTLAPSPELEAVLLRTWFGGTPDAGVRVRLELVRALTRLYYAGVMLSGSAAAGRSAPDTDPSAPGLAAFEQAIRDRQLKPGAPETRHVLGKMFLAAFLTGVAAPGFDAAIDQS